MLPRVQLLSPILSNFPTPPIPLRFRSPLPVAPIPVHPVFLSHPPISPLRSAHHHTSLPFLHLVPQVYAQLGSRLAPALSSRTETPHACGRILEGTEDRVSDPHTPAPPSPAPSPPRPSLGPWMWLSFRLLLTWASCVSPSYSENSSSPLSRTPTSSPRNPPQARDPGTRPPSLLP